MTDEVSSIRRGAIPMLAYADGVAALDWLTRAFGFIEKERMLDDAGALMHGEMAVPGGGTLMLATPSPHYEGPRRHREHCVRSRQWQQVPWVVDGVLVYVDDVQAHHERARQAGALILSPLEDGIDGRRYRAEDPEGHRWMFLQR